MEVFTTNFCTFLKENNLFTPLNMRVVADEKLKNITGCYVINEERLNNLNDKDLDNTYWEIETGEFFSSDQIKELENNRNNLIIKLDLSKKEDEVYQTVIGFCKSYEELCQKKYPEAPLPLEILKSIN